MFRRTAAVITIASLSVWNVAYSGKNLALGKPALQSSTWSVYAAERSVDGNENGNLNAGSCSHTEAIPEPWWLVDLMGVYLIHHLVIYNRATAQDRLNNTYIEGFLHYPLLCSKEVPQLCAHNAGPSGDVVNLTCVQEVRARYIRLRNAGIINICEVEVYGDGTEYPWCGERAVDIIKQDGQRLPTDLSTVDLGNAACFRDCGFLCLQRPVCYVYNYNSKTRECRVPEKLYDNRSEMSMDWDLYSIC